MRQREERSFEKEVGQSIIEEKSIHPSTFSSSKRLQLYFPKRTFETVYETKVLIQATTTVGARARKQFTDGLIDAGIAKKESS